MTVSRRRSVTLLMAALLVTGCASAPRPASPTSASDPRPSADYRRCSPADPDRYAWFYVIGQILYSTLGAYQPDPGPGLR